MPVSKTHPIDLWLWRKAGEVPEEEKWKWRWGLWDAIIEQVFNGEVDVRNVACPICGQKTLYAYFMAFRLSRRSTSARREYIGDRWWGCYACEVQKRDYGLLPAWVDDEDVVWASEKAKEWAEQHWAKIKERLNEDGAA